MYSRSGKMRSLRLNVTPRPAVVSFPLLLVFVSSLAGIAQGIEPARQYYEELGCSPPPTTSPTAKEAAPIAYNCSVLDSLTPQKCFYNMKSYEVNQVLRGEDLGSPCLHECICQKSYVTNRANWQCVHIECPEVLGVPTKPGCINLYEKGACCSVKTYCPKEEPTPEVKCEYKGRSYVEGQRFDVDDSCKTCVCKKGFNGSLTEPFCSKIKCDFYLHYSNYIQDGCLPTYYETDNCCPIPIWRCPQEDDEVIVTKTAEAKSTGPKCKFGSLELSIGEMLAPSEEHKCVECRCLAPPHPSCVMNTTCYTANQQQII